MLVCTHSGIPALSKRSVESSSTDIHSFLHTTKSSTEFLWRNTQIHTGATRRVPTHAAQQNSLYQILLALRLLFALWLFAPRCTCRLSLLPPHTAFVANGRTIAHCKGKSRGDISTFSHKSAYECEKILDSGKKINYFCVSVVTIGKVPEWSIGLAWKASVPLRVPRVRISPFPLILKVFLKSTTPILR